MKTGIDRRTFLRRSGATGLFLAPGLAGLARVGSGATPAGRVERDASGSASSGGYGRLRKSPDCPELALPPGFHCRKISEAGRPMADGAPVPNAFDGMAAFPVAGDVVRLVRNHELRERPPKGRLLSAERAYDTQGPGGVTTLELKMYPNGAVEPVAEFVTLAGTFVNCAGGATPWGSWLSCEETVVGRAGPDGTPSGLDRNHGYVFEVPSLANVPVDPVPLTAMGRFVHEAIAVDPVSGVVYLTEDQDPSGFYRFLPDNPGNFKAGGRLQMLVVRGRPRYDTRTRQRPGVRHRAAWVDIDDPDPAGDYVSPDTVYRQGYAKGGATFARLEGCCMGEGFVYFDATTGGDIGAGQVWQYQPLDPNHGELVLIFQSPSAHVLRQPDNICMSPRGGMAICEDGDGTDYLRGLTPDGQVFDFARNEANELEFTGVCFSPQGRTMFVNIQGALWIGDGSEPKGMTFAIWGPWENGAL